MKISSINLNILERYQDKTIIDFNKNKRKVIMDINYNPSIIIFPHSLKIKIPQIELLFINDYDTLYSKYIEYQINQFLNKIPHHYIIVKESIMSNNMFITLEEDFVSYWSMYRLTNNEY